MPSITAWFQQNQQTIFTILALIAIVIVGLLYMVRKERNAMDKVVLVVIGGLAAVYLVVIYVIIPVIGFIIVHWLAILISVVGLFAVFVVAWMKGWIRVGLGGGPPPSPPIPVSPPSTEGKTPLEQYRDYVFAMDPYDFEKYIGRLLGRMNYLDVQVTQQSKDHGIDVTAYKLDEDSDIKIGYIIQCKLWKDTPVPEPKVVELWGRISESHPHRQGIIVCTSGFSKPAIDFARGKGIACWDIEALYKNHQKYL